MNGDVRLIVPDDDDPTFEPELSIVVPALNEHITIAEFVEWCKEGAAKAPVRAEILIVDSSSDETAAIALEHGARVLATPKRGLGRAYIDAIPYVRGKFVVMGDCDLTYDFRELKPFVDRLRGGYEFVMGSRFKGSIEPKSMPFLHRYLGTPVTTWILNVLYDRNFSDIHCGMRGITAEALRRMDLGSQSWEYASEMVLKSVHMRLRTAEVGVRFYKDRAGRMSHHKRLGWFSPWQAAWINLRAMFVYGADFFVFRPGLVLMAAGLLLTLPVTFGPVRVGPVTLSLYWMLLGLTLYVLGLNSFYLGCLAQILFDYSGEARRRWLGFFRYDRSVLASVLLFVAGIAMAVPLVVTYVSYGLALPPTLEAANYRAVTALLLIVSGFMNFVFTLVLHAAALVVER
jgi:glycosyltransferase involved in cell wall biosynthesis